MKNAENEPCWRSVFYRPEYNDILSVFIDLLKIQEDVTVSDVCDNLDLNYGQVARRINKLYVNGIIRKVSRGYYELAIILKEAKRLVRYRI